MENKPDLTNPEDQVDIKEDNKNIKMFKDKLKKRRQVMKAEIVIFREN